MRNINFHLSSFSPRSSCSCVGFSWPPASVVLSISTFATSGACLFFLPNVLVSKCSIYDVASTYDARLWNPRKVFFFSEMRMFDIKPEFVGANNASLLLCQFAAESICCLLNISISCHSLHLFNFSPLCLFKCFLNLPQKAF